jgi:hypothetical protein
MFLHQHGECRIAPDSGLPGDIEQTLLDQAGGKQARVKTWTAQPISDGTGVITLECAISFRTMAAMDLADQGAPAEQIAEMLETWDTDCEDAGRVFAPEDL